jgi:serine kinase of HPr protein (carbohydrate metabolism regulator)
LYEKGLLTAPVQEKQINAPIQLVEQKKPAVAEKFDRLSLEASKQKCTELGFKPATEGYGKCVLQLSK